MSEVRFYFDEMMPRVPAEQLIKQGYTVIIATDVQMRGKTDPEHLAYATQNNLILVTFDRKFAGITAKSATHAGLICLSGGQNDFGMIVRTLNDFAKMYTAEEVIGQVYWF